MEQTRPCRLRLLHAVPAMAMSIAFTACDTPLLGSGGDSPTETSVDGVLDDDGEIGATGAPSPVAVPPLHESVDDYPAGRVLVDTGDGAGMLPVLVRVADTAERRRHGLMEVPAVPDGVGMWFVFDEEQTGGFWMKGTRTDLDIAWVDDTGHIVAIETMEVCEADPCPTYDPEAAYRWALEVRAGWLANSGVEVGDRILRDGQTP